MLILDCLDSESNHYRMVDITDNSVPQHSLLTIKIGYIDALPTGASLQTLSFTPFSEGLLQIVTIYIDYLLVSHCYSPYIIV